MKLNLKYTLVCFFVMFWMISEAQNITKMEYFIDHDPGFGMGNDIPLTPSPDISDLSFSANISSLPMGIHYIYLRVRDAVGTWSLTNVQIFYKVHINSPMLSDIVKMEYFIDKDPGYGKGFDVPVFNSTSVNVMIIPDLTICKGLHTIYLRTQDANGAWSQTNMDTITLPVRSSPVIYTDGTTSICKGQQLQLKASSHKNIVHQWKRNNVLIAGAHDSIYHATEEGEYKSILTLQNICSDSTNSVFITVNPAYDTTENIAICEGSSYKGHSLSGLYIDTLQTVKGCDSIVSTNLKVNPVYDINENISICQGESYKGHTNQGIYADAMQSINGCDSIVTTNLKVNPVYNTTENVAIDQGGFYLLPNGTTVSAAGTYFSNLKSIGSCDSIIKTVLTVRTGLMSTNKSIPGNLYPNPSKNGIFQINNGSFDKFRITIYSTNGKILFDDQISGIGTKTINFSGNPQGIYIAKIIGDGYVRIEKLIIE